MAGFRPAQVVIGIAGELVKGFTTVHDQQRVRADVPITEAELGKLIEGVQREAMREAERSVTWETGLQSVDVRLVHAAIVGAWIDGYAVTNPIGFQGRNVKIAIFNAFAPLVHLGALQTVAAQLAAGAHRGGRRAVRGRAGARQRAGPPGRGAVHRRRRRHDRRRARPPGRDRGDPDVRARRARVHEVDRRPAGAAVPARRGAEGRLRARHRRRPRGRRPRDRRRRRRGLGSRGRAGDGGAGGRRPAAGPDLPVRWRLAPARDPRGARRRGVLRSSCPSRGRPKCDSVAGPDRDDPRRDAACSWTSRT